MNPNVPPAQRPAVLLLVGLVALKNGHSLMICHALGHQVPSLQNWVLRGGTDTVGNWLVM